MRRLLGLSYFLLFFTLMPSYSQGPERAREPETRREFADLSRTPLAALSQGGRVLLEVERGRILAVDGTRGIVQVFDERGRSLAALAAPGRGLWGPLSRHSAARKVIVQEQRMLLILGSQVWLWEGAAFSEFADLQNPSAVFAVQGDEMYLADSSGQHLIAVADREGRISRRFGEPLVRPANPRNDLANDFIAFLEDDKVRVLFVYYPVFRVYSASGELQAEGLYERPARVTADERNPSWPELEEWSAEVEQWHPVLFGARAAGDEVFAYFNSFTLGVLGSDFRLQWEHNLLEDPDFAAVPRLIGLDAASRTILFGRRDGRGSSLKTLTFSTAGSR